LSKVDRRQRSTLLNVCSRKLRHQKQHHRWCGSN
jgi:hypothetical protein